MEYYRGKRLEIGFVRETFEKEGFKLLSTNYRNCYQKLGYLCPRGHKHSISWINWKGGGIRCPYCSKKAKPSIEFIKNEFERERFTLLSNSYFNCRTKLKYRCPQGHLHLLSWDCWKQGNRCPYCSGIAKKTFDEVRNSFEKEGYLLISKEYVSSSQKLEYFCKKGHRGSTSWSNWKSGCRCRECFRLSFIGEGHPRWKNYTQQELEKFKIYYRKVIQLSGSNYSQYTQLINPKDLPRGRKSYHLDHRFSIIDGFENDVEVKIISSPVNLQILSAFKNQRKHSKSSISLEKLHEVYEEWDSGKRNLDLQKREVLQ